MEIKPVNNPEGLYVSTNGKVFAYKKGKLCSLTIYESKSRNRKYRRAYCYFGGRIWSVSRIVAKTFIPNLKNKPYVGHKDNNPMNNSISNIYWCTQSENIKKASGENMLWDRSGAKNPYYGVIGDKHSVAKYSNELKIELFRYHQNHTYLTVQQLQEKFKIKSSRSVRKIIHKEDPVIVRYLKEAE